MAELRKFAISSILEYEVLSPTDFLLNIHAAPHNWQQIHQERLNVYPLVPVNFGHDGLGLNLLTRFHAIPGKLRVEYEAIVEVAYPEPTGYEVELSIANLPIEVLPYVWPSRYCESDSLMRWAISQFGTLPSGYGRVQGICDWIYENIEYRVGVTSNYSSTKDVLLNRIGVCRDFAHLGISFCRALNIPARFVTGYTWFADPPTDFHALFEVYLGDRWILFDATRMAPVGDLIRISTGKDAAETSFSTIFGNIRMLAMDPRVTLIKN